MKQRVSEPVTANGVNLAMDMNTRGMMLTSSIYPEYASAAGVLTIFHDLNDVPNDFQYSRVDDTGAELYATETQRANWTATTCEITASADGNFRVWFVKRIA